MTRFKFVLIFSVMAALAVAALSYAQDDIPGSPEGMKTVQNEELIKKGDLLTLQRCIEIALKKQPDIVAARNSVSAAGSKIGQAQAGYYPQIDLSAGYSRISPVAGLSSRSAGISSSRAYDQYTSSASLKQNIFDFGKTAAQVGVQRFNFEASQYELENTSEQIIYNVKQSYYGLLQARRNRDVADEVVAQLRQHLEQAKGFFGVGVKPKFDVTRAEVDLSNAKLNLIKAENAVRITSTALNNAMGVPEAPEYAIEDNLSFKKYEITFEDALSKAFNNRHDLRSLAAKRKSSEESVLLAEKGYYPAINGNASYNWSGTRFPLDDGWSAGATLTFPLFSGFLTKHQVAESEANVNVLKANEELLRQNIYFEVKQSYLNLKEAEERIPAAELAARQANENFDIAKGRYAAGVGNPIEVTDAQVAYTNAKTAHIQALYDYKTARAALEKAMGGVSERS